MVTKKEFIQNTMKEGQRVHVKHMKSHMYIIGFGEENIYLSFNKESYLHMSWPYNYEDVSSKEYDLFKRLAQ